MSMQCESCSYYEYDEEYDEYYCGVDLDEDEMAHFIMGKVRRCPYYAFNAVYQLARKQ